jgi:hypothetical protein
LILYQRKNSNNVVMNKSNYDDKDLQCHPETQNLRTILVLPTPQTSKHPHKMTKSAIKQCPRMPICLLMEKQSDGF